MKLFQFDDEFVEGVLNIYEQLGPNDIPHANYKQKTEETIPSGVGSLEQAEQSKKLKDRANNDKEFFNSVHANLIKLQEESERQPKQEGGDVDMQMSELMPLETKQQDMVPQMETEQQDMVPDMEMEEDYLDFILDEALTDEEEVMLETKLEQDEELAVLFDKVVDVAQEFAGAGLVEGPGNGVSDSIPARLSDGEFVFTAKAAKEIGTDTLMSVMKEAEAKADARQGMANGGMLPEEVKPSPVFGTKPDESTIHNEIKEGMVATNPLDPRHRYFQ